MTELNDQRGHQRQLHAKHPNMVLLHGGSPKSAERIAARWADHRNVPPFIFKPDWTRYSKAVPFKRDDAALDMLLIGVIVVPGTGIQGQPRRCSIAFAHSPTG